MHKLKFIILFVSGMFFQDFSFAQSYSITWTDLVNVDTTGNQLIKTNSTFAWNAGVASQNALEANIDGWTETTLDETTTFRIFGFSSSNGGVNYSDVQYGINFRDGGEVRIFESGVSRGTFGTYTTGDVFRLERTGSTIAYKKNGTTFYTSTVSSFGKLIVHAAFASANSTLKSVKASFEIPANNVSCGNITWIDLVNLDTTDGVLQNTSGIFSWNSGAVSNESLGASTDGWAEIESRETSTFRMFGLSSSNGGVNYADVEYGINFRDGGEIRIFENGVSRGDFGTYTSGDVFRVERAGTTITYKKNGTTFYTSTQSSSGQLIAHSVFASSNSTLACGTSNFSENNGGGEGEGSSFFVADDNESDTDIRYSEGKVVIGADDTNKPGDYLLYVQGGILTELAKVAIKNQASWADFVFESDYQLSEIKDIEQFIKDNNHLPNVPSANEMVKEGLDVAKMDAILLRQIEEIWLHLIELKKENQALKLEINKLR